MNRKELLKAITATMIGADKNGSPTGLDFLLFDKNWIRSFNDVLSVSYQIDTGIDGAVKGQEMVEILNKMEGDEIKISKESSKILIKDDKTTLKMTFMEQETLGQFRKQFTTLKTDNLKWSSIPEGFSEGLEMCLYSASEAPELGNRSGVNFTGSDIVATDNFRITLYELKSALEQDFTLPTEVIDGLAKFSGEFKKISITEAWAHFKDKGGLIVSVRKLLGKYPFEETVSLFDKNFPKGSKAKLYTLPDNIESSIARAKVLAESDETMETLTFITLKRSGKNLIVKGEKKFGEVEDKIPWASGKDFPENIELKVPPDFLKKIITATKTFQLSQNRATVLFKGKNFKHLMVCKIGK